MDDRDLQTFHFGLLLLAGQLVVCVFLILNPDNDLGVSFHTRESFLTSFIPPFQKATSRTTEASGPLAFPQDEESTKICLALRGIRVAWRVL